MVFTVTVDISPGKSAPARASTPPPYPPFVVQHAWPAHYQVVSVDPQHNGRPVEGGADLTWDEAAALRSRLNAEAMTQ